MKCISIQWEHVHTPKKYALRLTLMANSLAVASSVEMKVAVSRFNCNLPLLKSIPLGLTQKSLQRLFPCDTSMVVIIDDRADVWEWSPNLIKVIPCQSFSSPKCFSLMSNLDDFFVGIGDINSIFLPKVDALTSAAPPALPAGNNQLFC